MKPLSRPLKTLKKSYDAVVVGSGYGAGIAASRLARMGLGVAVLERGREIPVGAFPRTLGDATQEFQITSGMGALGSKLGLFDMRVNPDISVMVGCGLGGTSLINGNVMLKPDPRVFQDARWPEGLRAEVTTTLEEGYARAAHMLQPVAYPRSRPSLKKLSAFRTQTRALGARCIRPPISVTFDEDAENGNAAGVVQPACTLCGDCCSGCNVGAKNTTALNYLPDAADHGAEIFTQTAVRYLMREGGAWKVALEELDPEDGTPQGGTRTIDAKIVVLGAGTLGSTEILLRSKAAGLAVSPRVGHGFSGNGDVIAFGYNNDIAINGVGVGHPPSVETPPVGPVIAGLIDLRNRKPLPQGMVVQEGAIPSVLAPILPAIMKSVGPMFGTDTDAGDWFEEYKRGWASLFKGAYVGAVHNTQTFLVMAHDSAEGRMELDGERLSIAWPDAGDQLVFKRISTLLQRATAATGGTYVDNPMWSPVLGRNLISVHPLGGCGMGDDTDTGAIDHKCRVFGGDSESLEGLFVCDGAAVPTSLGVNPSLTISAIAERAMMHLAEDHGLSFTTKKKAGRPLRHAKK